MATKDNDISGLPDPMPKAPGNRKAGMPPRRSEAGGAKPHWLDPSAAKWTRERVQRIAESQKAKAGRFYVTDGQPKLAPGFRVL